MQRTVSQVRAYATQAAKTILYDFHVENGGKMVNYGGFLLPVQYSDSSVTNSHLHTRKHASLFDVSHMLQTEITGEYVSHAPISPNDRPTGGSAIELVEKLTTADLINLPPDAATLTVYTNQDGGVLDDLIVTKIDDAHLFVVSNAATREQDERLLSNNATSDVKVRFFHPEERSLLALQGPEAAAILQTLTDIDLSQLYFMTSSAATVAECGACRITRCGYTGEDGFEISIPSIKVADVAREILKHRNVKLAGLAARDSLRLEAGLCLYGNDIDASTSPIEAGLAWLVAKRRRQRADFPGASAILTQLKSGVARKRVGLLSDEGPPARSHCHIFDANDRHVGQVTSGCPSPSLGKNIAMGYVTSDADLTQGLRIKIREKLYATKVVKMPFVQTHYYTRPK